ncbi:MAG: DUF2573 family protein [Bacillus sp. (in: firmicutes)]
MLNEFDAQFESLVSKYTELLVGEANPMLIKKVETWIIYNHIAKTMPSLASHWNTQFPDAKEEVKSIIAEIKALNESKKTKE